MHLVLYSRSRRCQNKQLKGILLLLMTNVISNHRCLRTLRRHKTRCQNLALGPEICKHQSLMQFTLRIFAVGLAKKSVTWLSDTDTKNVQLAIQLNISHSASYPSSVASSNIRSGNKVGLFYRSRANMGKLLLTMPENWYHEITSQTKQQHRNSKGHKPVHRHRDVVLPSQTRLTRGSPDHNAPEMLGLLS